MSSIVKHPLIARILARKPPTLQAARALAEELIGIAAGNGAGRLKHEIDSAGSTLATVNLAIHDVLTQLDPTLTSARIREAWGLPKDAKALTSVPVASAMLCRALKNSPEKFEQLKMKRGL